ncbi:MAG: DUF554 domain-containing protein [Clostridiales bacterium]|nr:DUF554 domain-containing protein [Clostridiales bacterium]
MFGLGTIVNTAAILLGGALGLLLKKGIPQRVGEGIMKGLALVTLYLAVTGMLGGKNPLVAVLSVAIGGALGTLLDLDGKTQRFVEKIAKKSDGNAKDAFLTATLLFCSGAMAVTGAMNDGLRGDATLLYTKAVLDGISALVFVSTLGKAAIFSAIPVLLYQGGITLLAHFGGSFLPDATIAEMTCVGSLLLLGLGLNMLGVTKLKLMDYIPAIFLPILICLVL